MTNSIYPSIQLPTAIIDYSEYTGPDIDALDELMLRGELTSEEAKRHFERIIEKNPKAAFVQQCEAYAMNQGKSVPLGHDLPAQLWRNPLSPMMCCRVAVYVETGNNNALQIRAREDRAPFAVFYPGDPMRGKGATLAICALNQDEDEKHNKLSEKADILQFDEAGDTTAFSGLVTYTTSKAISEFTEQENHIKGECHCGTHKSHAHPPQAPKPVAPPIRRPRSVLSRFMDRFTQ